MVDEFPWRAGLGQVETRAHASSWYLGPLKSLSRKTLFNLVLVGLVAFLASLLVW
jgi:hypothetical protein